MLNQVKKMISNLSPYNRNIIILSSGSLISQAAIFLVSPVLTRLYNPEAFGILALFTSLAVIIGSLFTGKYEQAIFLPKEDHNSLNLIVFCLALSFALSIGLLALLAFTHDGIGSLFRLPSDARNILLLVPIMTFCIALYSCFQLWFQRKEAYTITFIISVSQAVFLIGANLTFALLGFKGTGLVFSYILSIFLSAILLILVFVNRSYFMTLYRRLSLRDAKRMAVEYKRFPRFVLPAELLVTVSQQIIPIILIALYTPVIVGLFSFSNRIMRTPSILLSSSVWGIYRNEAVKMKNRNLSILPIYQETFKKLVLIGFLPFLLLLLFGPVIFRVIFGQEWVQSGVYAQILSVFLFTELVAFPLSSTFVICDQQKTYFFLQAMSITLCISGLLIGKIFGSILLSIILYSVFGIISNLVSILLSHRAASCAELQE